MAGIYEPQIKKFEDGVEALRAAAPGLGGFQTAPSTRPRPQVRNPAPAAAGPATPNVAGAAAGVGAAVRRGVTAGADAVGRFVGNSALRAGATADAVTAPMRTAGSIVTNVGRGLAGQPAVAANPAPFTQKAGELVQGATAALSPRPAPVVPVGASRALSGPSSRPSMRPVASSGPAPATAAPAATAPIALNPGDPNTYTGGDGVTKAVPGLLTPPAPAVAARPTVTAAPSAAPAAAAASRAAQRDIGNNATAARAQIGADALNGFSPTSELMRRFEISQGGFKGSPQARAMAGQAILGQMGAITGATIDGARDQNDAALAGQGDQAAAEEGAAARAQRASEVNADLTNSYDARDRNTADQREERLARRPDVTVAADGSMGVVGADGTFRPVTGADGNVVRAPQAPKQTGELTEGDRLKSYDERYKAIAGDVTATPEAKAQALAALDADPLYAGLRGGSAAPPAEAIAALRANPAAAAQFDEVFGPGASAQYLGN